MKKIIISLAVVLGVAAIAGYGTYSFFSDKETSTGNTFTAGKLDLKVDSHAYYNGNECKDGHWVGIADYPKPGDACSITWGQSTEPNGTGIDINGQKFFDFADVKPGDSGENTVSLHVNNNDAWMCLKIDNLQNKENGCNGPEHEASDTTCDDSIANQGELAQNLYFTAWGDSNCNNVWDANENLLFSNQKGPASDVLNGKTYALADSTTGKAFPGGTTQCVGVKWCAGTMTIGVGNDGARVISCDGKSMGNNTQTDSMTADVTFQAEQARNNPSFRCVAPTDNTKETLILENKDANFNALTNDGTIGTLVFNKTGTPFSYTLEAHGLTPSIGYSLIYYADPWPGNHPGALIGTFNTDASGNIASTPGTQTIGTNIPNTADANNSLGGGKIWLIPSSAYNSGSNSVIVWPFTDKWLFESNLVTYSQT